MHAFYNEKFIPLVNESSVHFTMGALENIIGIVDMDGFFVNGMIYCKELGVLRVGDLYAASHIFDIGLRWNDLSDRAKRHSARYTNQTTGSIGRHSSGRVVISRETCWPNLAYRA